MSLDVVKSKASDFSGQIRMGCLASEITASAEITKVLERMAVHGDMVTITFDSELSGAESAALDAVISSHDGAPVTVYEKNFEVKTYVSNKLQTCEWFATDNGDGTYSDLASRDTYTWSGNTLTVVVVENLWSDGTVKDTVTETYFTNGQSRIKKVVKS